MNGQGKNKISSKPVHYYQGTTKLLMSTTASREAVLESLGTLGESQKHAIIFMLKRDYKIDLQAPINDLEAIFRALRGLFGEGAPILIDLITRNLSSRPSIRQSCI